MRYDPMSHAWEVEGSGQHPRLDQGDQLRNMFKPEIPIFILIDPMVIEVFPEIGEYENDAALCANRRKVWERETTRINLLAPIHLPIHLHPYLVHIKDKTDRLISFSLEIAHNERLATQADGLDGEGQSAHRIGGWLQSNACPEQIAERIGAMCQVNTSAYTRATYLRIADRRVFGFLEYVVGKERLTAQFGPINRWIVLGPTGQLINWDASSEEAKPLRQTVLEWKRMHRCELLHRSMAKWLGTLAQEGNFFKSRNLENIYCAFEQAIDDLTTSKRTWPQRFTSIHDETVWVALSILDPALLTNHQIQKLLEETSSVDAPSEPIRYMHEEIRLISGKSR